ncbi:MAG: hypothetical protein IJR44_02805 [Neisseriaceae bacterium]|nr:hypothetical protein [Neisseriaceae bacterium]
MRPFFKIGYLNKSSSLIYSEIATPCYARLAMTLSVSGCLKIIYAIAVGNKLPTLQTNALIQAQSATEFR